MYLDRILDLNSILDKKSCFLFGPRQSGKSSLIKHTLGQYRSYDLLDSEIYLELGRNPKRLEQEIRPDDKIIIIDEIQKLPNLLDEVHRLIEKYNVHFLLTGSSARKLRRSGVNLLGGRARSRFLHPFVFRELKEKFDLEKAVNIGLIPSIYLSDNPEEDLRGYAGTYLKEEIAAEGLTRNIPAFSRFLQVAAFSNGQIINYSKIATDAQVPASTIREYYDILKDTMIAYEVQAWKKTVKRKPFATSKIYFFDNGIARYLNNRSWINNPSPEMGFAFESYMAHELKTFCDYHAMEGLCFWRSTSGFEVDFIVADSLSVEIKAKKNIDKKDLAGLLAIGEDYTFKNRIVVSMEDRPRKFEGVEIVPWKMFLDRLWDGDLKV